MPSVKKQKAFDLYGIFGYPLGHTLSPAMQEAGFRALGIEANYLVLELPPATFKKVMRDLPECALAGFNVTVPYKETVLGYLDHVSCEAKAIGAVNTVYKKGKTWRGANTDMEGFLITLSNEGDFDPKGKKTLVLGGGGAARAVSYGLARRGAAELAVVESVPGRAEKIVRSLERFFKKIRMQALLAGDPAIRGRIKEADLVVNATPLGLKKTDPLVVPPHWIPKAGRSPKLFMDLIYNPAETAFLRIAKKRGHRTLNGLGMLLHQGARAFEYWTGKKAPVPVMRKALLDALHSKEHS